MIDQRVTTEHTREFFEQAAVFADSSMTDIHNNTAELYSSFFSDFDDKTLLSNPQFHGVGEWYYTDNFKPLADKGIEMGQDYMLKLKQLCDERGIDLTISVHPWRTQIIKGAAEDYYTRKWGDFCRENGIGFVNLFPLFIGNENALLVSEMYYIYNDNHWNEFGHRKVAERLMTYFEDEANIVNK